MSDLAVSYQNTLHSAANAYLKLGWSVIPVYGNTRPNAPKAAAVKWEQFQNRRPTPADLDEWFVKRGYGGLAVVCGKVSNIAVLDIDALTAGLKLKSKLPHLTETRTVMSATRQLPHYYYQLPEGLAAATVRVPGAEFRVDGAYVVAPPTQIQSGAWRLIRGGIPRTLTTSDLAQLIDFLAGLIETPKPNSEPRPIIIDTPKIGSAAALVNHYQTQAPRVGRNNALFSTALIARDSGWHEPDVLQQLVNVHAEAAAHSSHVIERTQQRQREAVRTISSAFSRPPQQTRRTLTLSNGLPNAVREKLLQIGKTATARVLDALYLAGKQGAITERDALEICRAAGIGRRSLRNALQTRDLRGKPLFKVINQAPRIVKSVTFGECIQHHTALSASNTAQSMPCTVAKRDKNHAPQRGRPPQRYLLPGYAALCRALGVRRNQSDTVTHGELSNHKRYRQTLYREHIHRAPGQYARGWLARRIGVSRWTSLRYDREIGITVRPMYQTQRVTWETVKIVPYFSWEAPKTGAWLQDYAGHRFPPMQSLARYLLKKGASLLYVVRVANHYSYNPALAPP